MRKLFILSILFIAALSNAQTLQNNAELDKKIQGIIKQMTLEEKASICSGRDDFTTKPIERFSIPSIWLSDGPSGLRKSNSSKGPHTFVSSTSFPTCSMIASSWDVHLAEMEGKAVGEECQANKVQIILAPGATMKRSPLCGRNFEYYSEDPVLSGKMAAAYINGVQKQGVGTSLKHFACNNQETERLIGSSEIDDRTFREIYLRSFEIAITEAQPWTIMCSYNKINGVYSSVNSYLLNNILRGEWGYQGMVVSDWGAVHDGPGAIKARLNLEMPGGDSAKLHTQRIIDAVKQGKVSESELDLAVADLLKIIFKANSLRKDNTTYDQQQHHSLAREIASQCIVLLKNDDNILPLNKTEFKKIAIIGKYAKIDTLINGGGSASLPPTKVDIPFDEIDKLVEKGVKLSYSDGYHVSRIRKGQKKVTTGVVAEDYAGFITKEQFWERDTIDTKLITEAVNNAKNADVAIIFVGLGPRHDSEGRDRKNIYLPESQNKLIEAITAVNKNVVIVSNNGSAIAMPWLSEVKALLINGLNGQAAGGAVADVLFGVVNPSGKLAETYPVRLEDTPSYLNFPGENHKVRYGEGIFVGYRYYETKKIEPLFPFGYGLSYTTFAYSGLKLSDKQINDSDLLEIKLKVKNTGNVLGKEVVQLYVRDVESSLRRPVKELKAFTKISLEPGEEKEVAFTLNNRDFSFYNPEIKKWVVESGDFEILVGASSADIKLKEVLNIEAQTQIK